MSEPGRKRGLKSYVATLVATILFPILWLQTLRLGRRHADADPRARLKVLAAIVIGVGILIVGFVTIAGFLANAQAGIYDSMDKRLATATGEAEYQDQLSIITASNVALPIISANLVKAESDLANRTAINATSPSAANTASLIKARDNVTKLQATQVQVAGDLAKAQARSVELEDNHAQYLLIHDAVQDQDDGEVHRLVDGVPEYSDAPGSKFPKFKDVQANEDAAFAKKDESVSDMQRFAWLFLWPGLAGAFFAPLAFALGSILARAFEPSDTVGFKPYPGAAAGLFLLFGAFGVPSIFFAAWVFNDAFGRSEEGQIAL